MPAERSSLVGDRSKNRQGGGASPAPARTRVMSSRASPRVLGDEGQRLRPGLGDCETPQRTAGNDPPRRDQHDFSPRLICSCAVWLAPLLRAQTARR